VADPNPGCASRGPSRRGVLSGILVALLLAAPITACGKDTTEPAATDNELTLVLDFVPNAVHAGIYRAIEAGYYADEGINLTVIEPGETSDPVKLVGSGQADIGLADPTDLATARARGVDVGAILAILQRPAGGLITRRDSDVNRPKDLETRSVGVTGVASDQAVLRTLVESDDGDLGQVRVVTVGFNGAQALAAGRVDGFIGFIAADAAQIEASGTRVRSFPLDEYGGPAYPGLVAFASPAFVEGNAELVNGFIDATTRGYEDTIEDPDKALDALVGANEGLDRPLSSRTLEGYLSMFTNPDGGFGEIDPAAISQLLGWLTANGIVEKGQVTADELILP